MSAPSITSLYCQRALSFSISDSGERRKRHSPHCLTTLGFGGLQVIFAIFAGQGVIHLSSLGLSRAEISIALVAGPVCGAVFQPIFGYWSDRFKSSWGRRKPFIAAGTAVLACALLTLAWAEPITRLLMPTARYETRRTALVTIAMLSIFLMFTSVQAVHVGLRALISDDRTTIEQTKANAWASGYSNLAAAVFNFIAFTDTDETRQSGRTVFMDMSLIASLCLMVTTAISCFGAKEQSVTSTTNEQRHKMKLREIWRIFVLTPSQIRTVCLVQVFAWSGWFAFLYYAVPYVNYIYMTEIRGPEATMSAAMQSSRMGSLTLVVYSLVALLMAASLPKLVTAVQSVFNMRHCWIASNAVFGLAMLGTLFVSSSIGTVVLFGFVGFSWAASAWVPYALVGAEVSSGYFTTHAYEAVTIDESPVGDGDEEKGPESDSIPNIGECLGLVYGIHNVSICLPQILMTLGMALMSLLSGKSDLSATDQGSDLVWVLRVGGICALVATYIATGIQEPCRRISSRT